MTTTRLPDFDDMLGLAIIIGDFVTQQETLETFCRIAEAEITRICNEDPKYQQGGKPPSFSFVKSAYHESGINNELVDKRYKIASLKGQLAEAELKFKVYQAMIDIYRTESANERKASSF